MASFKKITTQNVDALYERRTRVFLESAEDVGIFMYRWFSHKQDKLHFVSAEGGQSGGGGWQAVLDKVKDANSRNVKAYGIVDRDSLLAVANDLFWETDDANFHASQPFGDTIHVLRRWELENYLLQPAAFAEEVGRRGFRSAASDVTADTFLALADELIELTVLAVSKANPYKFTTSSNTDLNFDKEGAIKKLKAFGQAAKHPEEQWDKLSRILDGKKSLQRLCVSLGKSFNLKSMSPWKEMYGCLADNIASKQTIDIELVNLIDRLALS